MEKMEEFLEFYNANKPRIRKFLEEFEKEKDEKQVLGELMFCLCVPQSKAKYCREFVELIKKEDKIFSLNLEELRKRMNAIRFSDRKAEFLVKARKNFTDIKKRIDEKNPDLRMWLVDNVKGLGLKTSSHLLRNLGYRGLAIIDVHVINFMRVLGLHNIEGKNLTKKQYIELEEKFLKLAKELKIPAEELDIAIWLYRSGEKDFYG